MNLSGFVSASRYDLGCFHAGIIEGGPNELWEGVQFVSAIVNITITLGYAPKQPYRDPPEVVVSVRLPNSGAVSL